MYVIFSKAPGAKFMFTIYYLYELGYTFWYTGLEWE